MRYIFSSDQTIGSTIYGVQSGDSLIILPRVRVTGSSDGPNGSVGQMINDNGMVENYGDLVANGRRGVNISAGGLLLNHGTMTFNQNGTTDTRFTMLVRAAELGAGLTQSVNNDGVMTAHGSDAIAILNFSGGLNIQNSGSIVAADALAAIYANTGNNTTHTDLTNSGSISGAIFLQNDTQSVVTNSGSISGNITFGSGTDQLFNKGLISGSIVAGAGNDFIVHQGSLSGNIDLGTGNDHLDSSNGSISGTIVGGLGDDTILAGSSNDTIYGDNVSGDTTGGNDMIYAGAGNDLVYGGYGNDFILGNQGDDTLYGNQGNDFIHGGQGNDTIYGGQGDDTINGGVGNDTLAGNLGDDLFVFSANFGHDTVLDFSTASGNNDTIQFQQGTFASYTDVQSHMVQQGDNVVITLDAQNDIVLQHTTVAALTADHFIFG